MRKPAFCICENKGADQLRCSQCLRFRYIDSTIPLLLQSVISSLSSSSLDVPSVRFVSDLVENTKTDFLKTRFKLNT